MQYECSVGVLLFRSVMLFWIGSRIYLEESKGKVDIARNLAS
jgi:hypothetical protein